MKTNIQFFAIASFAAGLVAVSQVKALSAETEGNLENSFQVSAGGKLTIDADRGSIHVKTDGSDKAEIHVFRKVKGGKEKAEELLKNNEVTFSQDGNNVSVVAKNKTRRSSFSSNEPHLDVRYEITIPKQFDVDLKTSGGDIRVSDLEGTAATHTSSGSIRLAHVSGQVNAINAGGDISVEEGGAAVSARTSSGSIVIGAAKGKVELSNSGGNIKVGEGGADIIASTSSGSIKVTRANGKVEAKNSGGDIAIEFAGGSVTASTSSGSIQVGTVKGEQVTLRDSGGNIVVGEVEGRIDVQTSSGSIKIKSSKGEIAAKDSGGDIVMGEAGSQVTAQTSSGSIRLEKAVGAVELKNSGGDVFVQDVHGPATISTSSGSIQVARAKGKVDAKNAGGSIKIGEAQGVVIAQTSSGEINVDFAAAPKTESRLEVSGGGIKVGLPRSAGVDVDARSSGGRVVSSLAVGPNGSSNHGALQGKLNGGGAPLILRSSSGDIRINETATLKAEAEK